MLHRERTFASPTQRAPIRAPTTLPASALGKTSGFRQSMPVEHTTPEQGGAEQGGADGGGGDGGDVSSGAAPLPDVGLDATARAEVGAGGDGGDEGSEQFSGLGPYPIGLDAPLTLGSDGVRSSFPANRSPPTVTPYRYTVP